MAINTPALELAAVEAAIEAIYTGGQEATAGSVGLVNARLDMLLARKDVLEARISRQTYGGIRVRGGTPV